MTTTQKTTKRIRVVVGTVQSGDMYFGTVSRKWRQVESEMVGRPISGLGVLRFVEAR